MSKYRIEFTSGGYTIIEANGIIEAAMKAEALTLELADVSQIVRL